MNLLAARAAILIASVYGYFLIFAEFSFVELIRSGGASPTGEKLVLGTMAAAGIAAGFLVAWRGVSTGWLRGSLAAAALVAGLAPFLSGMPFAIGIALACGAALGIATVSLATLLRGWCTPLWVGIGTGLGYAFCNLPWIFQSAPYQQSWIACALALVGLAVIPEERDYLPGKSGTRNFHLAVLFFTALVWLDSAAFFIIQHEPEMKAGTWGAGYLWRNAAVHFTAALLAGLWMEKGNIRALPIVSWGLLAVAGLAANQASTHTLAGWLYPAGVSIYSAALVAWPAWFGGTGDKWKVGWRAAFLFGIAGWFGSANGIGMAETLERVPGWFMVAAGIAVVVGTMGNWRIACVLACLSAVYLIGDYEGNPPAGTAIERGRRVYLSEGCIHCHSQYIRPENGDEILWGTGAENDISGKPVLIGNRRQGPDLSAIGLRRSTVWLKQHFIDPQAFAQGSAMPSYVHLFADRRGDDLVAYLASLGMEDFGKRQEQIARWKFSETAGFGDGEALFSRLCAVCHGAGGLADGKMAAKCPKPPANLAAGPFVWSADETRLPAIIKFGIPGTDMPGHETLPESDITALRDHLLRLRKR